MSDWKCCKIDLAKGEIDSNYLGESDSIINTLEPDCGRVLQVFCFDFRTPFLLISLRQGSCAERPIIRLLVEVRIWQPSVVSFLSYPSTSV